MAVIRIKKEFNSERNKILIEELVNTWKNNLKDEPIIIHKINEDKKEQEVYIFWSKFKTVDFDEQNYIAHMVYKEIDDGKYKLMILRTYSDCDELHNFFPYKVQLSIFPDVVKVIEIFKEHGAINAKGTYIIFFPDEESAKGFVKEVKKKIGYDLLVLVCR